MNRNGLTISMIFEAESANYGEGLGNVSSLKKLSRGNGESYSYISRQALRYNIINQMGMDNTPIGLSGSKQAKVLQFELNTNIREYPEIDLFGYMKTVKSKKKKGSDNDGEENNKEDEKTKTRAAVVRLSHGVALESFNADLDFLTNKGLLDRYNATHETLKDGNNIAQSEIHKSYYAYTVTVDLDQVGKDVNDNIEISPEEKCNRVINLLKTIKFLYRDIKGRRENLTPIFAIGGVYETKNPFFENRLVIKNNKLNIQTIQDVLSLDEEIQNYTKIGVIKGIFENDDQIEKELKPTTMGKLFEQLGEDVKISYQVEK